MLWGFMRRFVKDVFLWISPVFFSKRYLQIVLAIPQELLRQFLWKFHCHFLIYCVGDIFEIPVDFFSAIYWLEFIQRFHSVFFSLQISVFFAMPLPFLAIFLRFLCNFFVFYSIYIYSSEICFSNSLRDSFVNFFGNGYRICWRIDSIILINFSSIKKQIK